MCGESKCGDEGVNRNALARICRDLFANAWAYWGPRLAILCELWTTHPSIAPTSEDILMAPHLRTTILTYIVALAASIAMPALSAQDDNDSRRRLLRSRCQIIRRSSTR